MATKVEELRILEASIYEARRELARLREELRTAERRRVTLLQEAVQELLPPALPSDRHQ